VRGPETIAGAPSKRSSVDLSLVSDEPDHDDIVLHGVDDPPIAHPQLERALELTATQFPSLRTAPLSFSPQSAMALT